MKLLFVSQDFPPVTGGIQTYSHQLALNFSRKHEVSVIAPAHRKGATFDRHQPYRTYRFPIGHTSMFGINTFFTIASIASKTGSRTVFHSQHTTATGSMMAKRLGLIDNFYIAAHGREILRNGYTLCHPAVRKRVLLEASALFPVSRYTSGLLTKEHVPDDRIKVVNNGVDLEHFFPREVRQFRETNALSGKRIILSAARLVPRKGMDTVIRAFDGICERYDDVLLLIAGDGPDRKRLENLAGRHRKTGRIRFAGHVPYEDLPFYYSAADVFAMPARQEEDGSVEGFGLVFLEANACSTAVIGSFSGGIPDAVEHGVNGLLVDPGSVRHTARALSTLLDDYEYRSKLARQGMKRAQRFTWENAAAKIMDCMEVKK